MYVHTYSRHIHIRTTNLTEICYSFFYIPALLFSSIDLGRHSNPCCTSNDKLLDIFCCIALSYCIWCIANCTLHDIVRFHQMFLNSNYRSSAKGEVKRTRKVGVGGRMKYFEDKAERTL